MPTLFDERAEDDLARDVRRAVAAAEFDYPALVREVHRRADRIRRRRVIVTGAGVLVLAPAALGGVFLVLPSLLPSGIPAVDTRLAPVPAPSAPGPASPSAPVPATPEPGDPPWQEGVPPQAAWWDGPEEDLPNAWEIPDARPTGIQGLDALGAPDYAADYPWIVPVEGLMSCDPARTGGVQPVAGRTHAYSSGGVEALTIQVTGWEDSVAARDGLVADGYTLCSWDRAPGEPLGWAGHEGDPDHLLFLPQGADRPAAVVRQGDYLVAVTGGDASEGTVRLVAEVAEKTAANLEALDPLHGRD